MKTLRFALPLIALAGLLSSGCILTSAQIMATYDLPNPFTVTSSSTLQHVDVDLNEIGDYADNKDKLKDVVDLAILGKFINNTGSPALGVTVYITKDITNYTTTSQVTTNGIKVWGPFNLPAGASTTTITWDGSAALFGSGKSALIDEVKGDGKFSLYAVGTTGTYNIEIQNGALVVVLDGGI